MYQKSVRKEKIFKSDRRWGHAGLVHPWWDARLLTYVCMYVYVSKFMCFLLTLLYNTVVVEALMWIGAILHIILHTCIYIYIYVCMYMLMRISYHVCIYLEILWSERLVYSISNRRRKFVDPLLRLTGPLSVIMVPQLCKTRTSISKSLGGWWWKVIECQKCMYLCTYV